MRVELLVLDGVRVELLLVLKGMRVELLVWYGLRVELLVLDGVRVELLLVLKEMRVELLVLEGVRVELLVLEGGKVELLVLKGGHGGTLCLGWVEGRTPPCLGGGDGETPCLEDEGETRYLGRVERGTGVFLSNPYRKTKITRLILIKRENRAVMPGIFLLHDLVQIGI